MRKTTMKLAIGAIFLCLIVLGLIMPRIGRVSPSVMQQMRIDNLQQWHEKTAEYIKDKGHLPDSLFDVYVFNIRNPIVLTNPENKNKINFTVNDPNAFSQIAEYGFHSKDDNWYITELKLFRSTDYLLIDSTGVIHKYDPHDN